MVHCTRSTNKSISLHKIKIVWDSIYKSSSVLRHIIAQKTHNSHDNKPLQQAHLIEIADNYIASAADQLKA
jgi:hypothetical protein